jgi:hypothetical protein
MSNRWDNDDDFEFAGGNSEDEFWAEFQEEDDPEDMSDAEEYAIHFRGQELEIADKYLSVKILDRAIAISKSNFFWHFLSRRKQLATIRGVYRSLVQLMTPKES